MDLNNPDVRREALRQRLTGGEQLVAVRIAKEFDVSLDTVRRDLIALEDAGDARRVRGGAIKPAVPAAPMEERLSQSSPAPPEIARAARSLCEGQTTLILDGGTTVLALARLLGPERGQMVITPSPWIAVACRENGVDVTLIGGQISVRGGICVGMDTEAQLAAVAGGLAVLGACGLDDGFGLSSDDVLESAVKRAMARSAREVAVLADRRKIGLRARYRTLEPPEIGHLVTDAPPEEVIAFRNAGIEVHHA